MSNNKVYLGFTAPFAYSQEGNATFVNSNIDALLAYANDFIPNSVVSGALTYATVDTSYLYGAVTATGKIDVNNIVLRQDVQTLVPIRLPQATENMLGVIVSASDAFKSYFYNSVGFNTNAGFVRVGIVNFTASQPTNPFAPGQQATLQAVWSFLDIPKK